MLPVGQAIYLWRTHKKLTQEALAGIAGVSRPNLSAIEQGGRDLTLQTLRRIAQALGVSAGTLADGISPKSKHFPPALNRYSMDRIARLAAGERLRATESEKGMAFDFASIMKSKIPRKNIKQKRLRSIRAENEVTARLKTELGGNVFNHLIRRIEKNLL